MICDTGCDIHHAAIADSIIEHRSFSQSTLSVNARHGTHVAGIISGHSDGLTGVAPASKLYIAQIMKGASGNYEWLTGALEWAMVVKPDVLNLSIAYSQDNQTIRAMLESLTNGGTIVSTSYARHPDVFPSSYNNVVSVAGYEDSTKPTESKIDVYTHNEFKSSVPVNRYETISGNSMAAAFFSGVAALAKAYDRYMTKERLLTTLKDSSEPVVSNTNFHSRVCY